MKTEPDPTQLIAIRRLLVLTLFALGIAFGTKISEFSAPLASIIGTCITVVSAVFLVANGAKYLENYFSNR